MIFKNYIGDVKNPGVWRSWQTSPAARFLISSSVHTLNKTVAVAVAVSVAWHAHTHTRAPFSAPSSPLHTTQKLAITHHRHHRHHLHSLWKRRRKNLNVEWTKHAAAFRICAPPFPLSNYGMLTCVQMRWLACVPFQRETRQADRKWFKRARKGKAAGRRATSTSLYCQRLINRSILVQSLSFCRQRLGRSSLAA